MKGVISVIVPIYNVEAYLSECLDSILSQSYKDLEVILINDGSTDASPAICEEYAAKDNRIRLIHQKNAGGAAAKNAGLRVASGEYLSFVDSDDYLEPDAYCYMLGLLQEHNADVVECCFRDIYRNRTQIHDYHSGTTVVDGKQFLCSFAAEWPRGLLWNKLYVRSLFADIFFEEGHKIDDEYFTYQGIMNARYVVCDERVIYNYRKRASGIMASAQSKKQISIDRVDFMAKRRENIARRFPDLQKIFDISFMDALTFFPDYPDNDVQSIQAYRRYGRAYFLQPGNTLPPRHLLRGLLRLYLTPAKKLIQEADKHKKPVNPEEYFP